MTYKVGPRRIEIIDLSGFQVMPLMLGSLPSGMMKDVDHYGMLVSTYFGLSDDV